MEHRIKVVCERPQFLLDLSSSCHPGLGELAIPTRRYVPVDGVSAGNAMAQGVCIRENDRGTALQGI